MRRAVLMLAVLSLASCSKPASPSPITHTLAGTVGIEGINDCGKFKIDAGGISAAASHATIEIHDASDKVIGTAIIDPKVSDTCAVSFLSSTLPDTDFYRVVVTVKGIYGPLGSLSGAADGVYPSKAYSREDMQASQWQVALLLPYGG